jgi:hypothetical protein
MAHCMTGTPPLLSSSDLAINCYALPSTLLLGPEQGGRFNHMRCKLHVCCLLLSAGHQQL